MSSFKCPVCKIDCLDTYYGYITGCIHNPILSSRYFICSNCKLYQISEYAYSKFDKLKKCPHCGSKDFILNENNTR
jgi:DNA replicative helicase MCM subunit Mcm2 (Cdc46/Mcm family)